MITNKKIAFGSNVSHANNRTSRSFRVNIKAKRFFSNILNRNIKLSISNKGLRTIDKYGGIDAFFLSNFDFSINHTINKIYKQYQSKR